MSQESGMESAIEEEISPLEYARQNGLAHDFRNDPVHALSNVYNLISQDIQPGFLDDDLVPAFDFGPPFTIKERPSLTREAALAIESISGDGTEDSHEIILSSALYSRQRKKLKFEIPLLTYDEDHALQPFKRKADFEIPFSQIRFPVEPVDQEKDEAMRWPARYHEIGPSYLHEINREKLTVGSDIVAFLQHHPSKITITDEGK